MLGILVAFQNERLDFYRRQEQEKRNHEITETSQYNDRLSRLEERISATLSPKKIEACATCKLEKERSGMLIAEVQNMSNLMRGQNKDVERSNLYTYLKI